MLTEGDKPAACTAQAPMKLITCHAGCGAQVSYRTNSKVVCADCAVERKRAKDRRAAARQRRKKGIQEVKGATFSCQMCGTQFVGNGSRFRFCPGCRQEANRKLARERQERVSRERGVPKIGENISCGHCRVVFRKAAPRERYCEACKALQEQGRLPHLVTFRTAYAKEWREARRDDPEWREREKVRLKALREKRKLNPAFSINERMSASIRASLKGGKDGASWEMLVGYTLADLVRHLERQFVSGMSWENRDQWQIDHRQPLSSFKFETAQDHEFKAAWALSNLQPLWSGDNLKKNDIRLYLL